MAIPIDVAVLKCRNFFPTGNLWNRALFTGQKKSAPTQSDTTARIAPKVCQGQSTKSGSQCSKFHTNRFTFGGVIAERVKAVLLAHRVNLWFASNTFEANNEYTNPCYKVLGRVLNCKNSRYRQPYPSNTKYSCALWLAAWRRLVVTALVVSRKLLYVEPG